MYSDYSFISLHVVIVHNVLLETRGERRWEGADAAGDDRCTEAAGDGVESIRASLRSLRGFFQRGNFRFPIRVQFSFPILDNFRSRFFQFVYCRCTKEQLEALCEPAFGEPLWLELRSIRPAFDAFSGLSARQIGRFASAFLTKRTVCVCILTKRTVYVCIFDKECAGARSSSSI